MMSHDSFQEDKREPVDVKRRQMDIIDKKVIFLRAHQDRSMLIMLSSHSIGDLPQPEPRYEGRLI